MGSRENQGNRGKREKKELRAVEALCRTRLHRLESWMHLEDVADVQGLCNLIEAHLDRRIHLEPWPLAKDVAGLWIASATRDYIFYAQDATPPHQEHIILHELAHILSGHPQKPIDVQLLQNTFFSHLDHDAVHLALSRSCYDDNREHEAEVLASLIEQRWRMARPGVALPSIEGHAATNPADPDAQRVRELLADFVAKLQNDN